MNIIARKPKITGDGGLVESETLSPHFIVVDRGEGHSHQFVSATATNHSLSHGQWFWGHYFKTRKEALDHFNARS